MTDAKTEISACWDKSSVTYDTHYGHGLKSDAEANVWKARLKEIAGDKPLKILDVCTGTGFLALFFAELGHDVKGVDLSEGMMGKAREKAAAKGLNITFQNEDAEDLRKEADVTYDLVVNRHLLWTILSPEKALAEWNRVLKPGGRVVIIDGNWSDPNVGEKMRSNFGKFLIMITEFRNPWKQSGSYSKKLNDMLPMRDKSYCRTAKSIVESAGFCKVTQYYLDDIDAIERNNMPLKTRLVSTWRRHVIVGEKPAKFS